MSHVKPNGKATKSPTAYVKAWRDVTRPLENAYNLKVIAFDPDLLVRNEEGQTAEIPLWLAKRMVDRNGAS